MCVRVTYKVVAQYVLTVLKKERQRSSHFDVDKTKVLIFKMVRPFCLLDERVLSKRRTWNTPLRPWLTRWRQEKWVRSPGRPWSDPKGCPILRLQKPARDGVFVHKL